MFFSIRYFLLVLWCLATGAGFVAIERYAHTPAQLNHQIDRWPASSHLQTAHGKPTLVMFAHPHCPCTRASMNELSRILSQCEGQVTASVVFLEFESIDKPVKQSGLWRQAMAIPHLHVAVDHQQIISRLFQARSSGETFLFQANGNLSYHGGITLSRGHEGDNTGHDAIVSILTKGTSHRSMGPVYGCSLSSPRTEE
ncbi:thioredoxin domain-containing protein [Rubripirellula reticaptiva]|uniref:RedB protein n=1 Tax=Rubripirellula reticaptiva TaxID=2528013 RepID=A0A5C6EMN8_9BACT|nr:hypothetical protein [Rubripirellula reticaptiva]TWU49775.1 hypothetical protein Poly59_44000 [Rubripirellula reticaptiva]